MSASLAFLPLLLGSLVFGFCVGCGTQTALPTLTPDAHEFQVLSSEVTTLTPDLKYDAVFRLDVPAGNPTTTLRLVDKSCGCVGLKLHGQLLNVGETANFPAETSSLLSMIVPVSRAGTGRSEQHVTIEFQNKIRNLRCGVVVADDISWAPNRPQVQLTPKDREQKLKLHVVRRWRGNQSGHGELQVESDHSRVISVDSGSDVDQWGDGLFSKEWIVDVMFDASALQQGIDEANAELRLIFRIGATELIRRSILVRVAKVFGIAAPTLIHFGDLEPGTSQSRNVCLRAMDKEDFQIQSVECPLTAVSAKHRAETSQRQFITITLAPSVVGEIAAPVEIVTDHPLSPRVTILVKCRVR